MSKRYSIDDYRKAVAIVKKGYDKAAEEVLRWYFVTFPKYYDGHFEYAKSLLFEKTGDNETDTIRSNTGFKILDNLLSESKLDGDLRFMVTNTKIKALFENERYLETYELCDSLLGTGHEPYCNYYLGRIDYKLGDKYSALDRLQNCDAKYPEFVFQELSHIMIADKDFEQAENYIKKMKKARKLQNSKTVIEEVFLNIRREDYKEAYEKYAVLRSRYRRPSQTFINIGYFLEYKLGKNDLKNIGNNYLMSQVRDFSDNKTKSHINRLSSNGSDTYLILKNSSSLNELYEFAQMCVNEDEPYICGLLDYYVIECCYDGEPRDIGFVRGNIPTNVIKVETISGTKNIVSITPLESLPYIRQIVEENRGKGRKRK